MFSHAVIDHVSDIDNFLTKAIKLSNRYVYISAYRGFFPGIEHHMMNYDNKDGCYYNDVSVKQVERLMEKLGKSDEEYLISAQSSGNKKTPDRMDTIIQVTKQGSVETIA